MEQLQQQRSGDQRYLESIRRLYRFIGDRTKSLEISRVLFKTAEETPTELISDLISLQQTHEALSMARDYNLISEAEKLELGDILGSSQDQPKIRKNIRRAINTLDIFPHFKSDHFNPSDFNQIANNEKAIICVIHVGKCAGESVIESLKKSFAEDLTCIVEYHVFDSNDILTNAINRFADDDSVHWIILNRDPASRWISAFNWDYHLYHLNQYFFCHEQAKKDLARYDNCLDLARGISERHDEAVRLSRFNHLAFGHMAMGQAWYLTEEVISRLSPSKTSLIRTENIEADFRKSVKKITTQFSFLESSVIKMIHTKNNFHRRYKPGTLKTMSDFNTQEAAALKDHLSNDYCIEELLIRRFST